MQLWSIVRTKMSIYRTTYHLKNNDVNLYRRLRTSRLFEMLQAACVMHTEQLGAGRTKTLDKGLLWVVIQQTLTVERMPEYDEKIVVETWPGNTMHVLFPRYFRVLDVKGNILINGSALWTLIDAKTRSFVFANQYGIDVPGESHPGEAGLPKAIKTETTDTHQSFKVPFSYCDLNGHMNNARYLDLVEDALPCAAEGRQFTSITTQYDHEIRYGETIDLSWGKHGNAYFIRGDGKKNCFRIFLQYRED